MSSKGARCIHDDENGFGEQRDMSSNQKKSVIKKQQQQQSREMA